MIDEINKMNTSKKFVAFMNAAPFLDPKTGEPYAHLRCDGRLIPVVSKGMPANLLKQASDEACERLKIDINQWRKYFDENNIKYKEQDLHVKPLPDLKPQPIDPINQSNHAPFAYHEFDSINYLIEVQLEPMQCQINNINNAFLALKKMTHPTYVDIDGIKESIDSLRRFRGEQINLNTRLHEHANKFDKHFQNYAMHESWITRLRKDSENHGSSLSGLHCDLNEARERIINLETSDAVNNNIIKKLQEKNQALENRLTEIAFKPFVIPPDQYKLRQFEELQNKLAALSGSNQARITCLEDDNRINNRLDKQFSDRLNAIEYVFKDIIDAKQKIVFSKHKPIYRRSFIQWLKDIF